MSKTKGWKKVGDGYWKYQESPLDSDAPSFFKEPRHQGVSVNKIMNPSLDPNRETLNPELIRAYSQGYRWIVDIYGQECPSLNFICHPFETLKKANNFAIEFMRSHPNGYHYKSI